MKRVLFFFAAAMALASCVKEEPTDNWEGGEGGVTINAVAPKTKTQLVDGTNVQWTPGDKIKMCFDVQPNFNNKKYGPTAELESPGTEVSEKTFFKGSIDMTNAGGYGFIAYPSTISFESSGETWDDFKTVVSYNLASNQTAVENTFAPNLNLSWDKVTKTQVNNNINNKSQINAQFKNMCALIKVTLPKEEYNVNEIKIESASDGLTGDRSLIWEATSSKQELKLGNFKSAVNEVSLANEDGSNLTPGASYYAVVWPGQHSGLTFTFTDDKGLECVKDLSKTVNCEVGKITEINVKTLTFKEAEPELTTNNSSLNFAAAGGSSSFSFNTNKNWTITSDQSWLSLDQTTGEPSKDAISINATCAENTAYTSRTATITISAGGLTQTINVTQAAAVKVVSLSVSTTSLSVAGQGGTASFTVTCNDNWTITDIPDWMTLSRTSGTESASAVTVTITAKQNFFYNKRSKSITIKSNSDNTVVKYISISQNGVTSFSIGDAVGKAGDMEDGQAYIIRNNSNNNYYWRAQNSKLVYTTWASGASIAYAFVYHRDDSKGKSSDDRYTSVSTGAWQSCHTEAYLDSKFEVYYKNISSAVYVANSNRWESDKGNDIDMCQIGSTYSIAWNGSKYLWGSTSESNRQWLVYKAVPQYLSTTINNSISKPSFGAAFLCARRFDKRLATQLEAQNRQSSPWGELRRRF